VDILHDARQKTWILLHGLTDEALNERPAPEEWSIQEILDHLNKTDLMAVHVLKTRFKDSVIKDVKHQPLEIAEDRTQQRKAPEKLLPERKLMTLERCKDELDRARNELLTVISSISDKELTKVLPHPVFNELSVKQWIEFIGHHEIRHDKQMEEIIKRLTSE
jgi:uncharacterized damage-inducible protein DinB